MNEQTTDDLYTSKENFFVVLDSRNAITYKNGSYNSNVKFEFEETITAGFNTIQMLGSVAQFTAPKSFYNINETNSFLSITVNGTTTYTATFTYGNYNSTTFITSFQSLFPSFTISMNSLNNIFTITNTTYNFSINETSTLGVIMGFTNGTKYSSINKSLVLPYTCNFNGLQNINIHFENIGTRNMDSFSSSMSNIIQSIPIDANETTIKFIRQYDFSFTIHQYLIDYIEIEIKDDLGNFINFNNQNWNLVLCFTIIKDIQRFKHLDNFHKIVKTANVPLI